MESFNVANPPCPLQEKRYRSMQEHIRRAHPNHYIPKLPATEESFLLMVTTPPDQRAHLSPLEPARPRRPHGHGRFLRPHFLNVLLISSPGTGIVNGYSQISRIGTSTLLIPAPRPPLELSTNPTPPLRPRLLRSLNCTTIAWPPTGILIWYVLFVLLFFLDIPTILQIMR
jgi:hypothetical protein